MKDATHYIKVWKSRNNDAMHYTVPMPIEHFDFDMKVSDYLLNKTIAIFKIKLK